MRGRFRLSRGISGCLKLFWTFINWQLLGLFRTFSALINYFWAVSGWFGDFLGYFESCWNFFGLFQVVLRLFWSLVWNCFGPFKDIFWDFLGCIGVFLGCFVLF
jgi:hypothetical protein